MLGFYEVVDPPPVLKLLDFRSKSSLALPIALGHEFIVVILFAVVAGLVHLSLFGIFRFVRHVAFLEHIGLRDQILVVFADFIVQTRVFRIARICLASEGQISAVV